MRKRREGEIGGLTRREVLHNVGKIGVAAGLLALSPLDRLSYAVAAQLSEGRTRPLDWSCGTNVWYQCMVGYADCPGGAGHDCDSGFRCPAPGEVTCNAEPTTEGFKCWNPNNNTPYGCTDRTFKCMNEDAGDQKGQFTCGGSSGGGEPHDFKCDVGEQAFQCGASNNGAPNGHFVCDRSGSHHEYLCDVQAYRC